MLVAHDALERTGLRDRRLPFDVPASAVKGIVGPVVETDPAQPSRPYPRPLKALLSAASSPEFDANQCAATAQIANYLLPKTQKRRTRAMVAAAFSTIDKTVQETNRWLKSIMRELGTDDRHFALTALRTTLHALRDRIGPENAVHLGAQLPILIRGFYYEGWHMAATPTKERHLDQFLAPIAEAFPEGMHVDPAKIASAVFEVMWERVDPGEVEKIVKILPHELRDLWPVLAYPSK